MWSFPHYTELEPETEVSPFLTIKGLPWIWQSHWWLNLVEQGEKRVSCHFMCSTSETKIQRLKYKYPSPQHQRKTAQTVESCSDPRDEGDTLYTERNGGKRNE